MREPFRSVIRDSLEGLYGANRVQAHSSFLPLTSPSKPALLPVTLSGHFFPLTLFPPRDNLLILAGECEADGDYIPSNLGIDSLAVGFYRGKDLIYAARVRAGLVPATRREVFERLKSLKAPKCPFVNPSELTAGRSPRRR